MLFWRNNYFRLSSIDTTYIFYHPAPPRTMIYTFRNVNKADILENHFLREIDLLVTEDQMTFTHAVQTSAPITWMKT